MPESEDPDQEVLKVADEIARYLEGRDRVADTLEGIAQWWILQQRLQEEMKRVEKAVNYLCQQGLVNKRVLSDGKVLYVAKGNN